jgi:hypothetical protein
LNNIIRCSRCGLRLIAEEGKNHHCTRAREIRDITYVGYYMPMKEDDEIERLLQKYLGRRHRHIKSERMFLIYGADGVLYRFRPPDESLQGDRTDEDLTEPQKWFWQLIGSESRL